MSYPSGAIKFRALIRAQVINTIGDVNVKYNQGLAAGELPQQARGPVHRGRRDHCAIRLQRRGPGGFCRRWIVSSFLGSPYFKVGRLVREFGIKNRHQIPKAFAGATSAIGARNTAN